MYTYIKSTDMLLTTSAQKETDQGSPPKVCPFVSQYGAKLKASKLNVKKMQQVIHRQGDPGLDSPNGQLSLNFNGLQFHNLLNYDNTQYLFEILENYCLPKL